MTPTLLHEQAWIEIRDTFADSLLNTEQKKAFCIAILQGKLANHPSLAPTPPEEQMEFDPHTDYKFSIPSGPAPWEGERVAQIRFVLDKLEDAKRINQPIVPDAAEVLASWLRVAIVAPTPPEDHTPLHAEQGPERVYLHLDEGMGDFGGASWCEDRIEDTDVEYIRADLIGEAANGKAKIEIAALRERHEIRIDERDFLISEGSKLRERVKELEEGITRAHFTLEKLIPDLSEGRE